jgi:hypothetical protein
MKQYGNLEKTKFKLRQDKGIKNEYEYIYKVIKGQTENSVIQDAFLSHRLLIEGIGK